MQNIEVEIRSFITEVQYREFLEFFSKEWESLGEDYQETYYFDCPEDLRIQKNNTWAKIWLKKGKIHDEAREEIELQISKDDFEKSEKLFLALDYNVEIKWFRTRHTFFWKNITVTIDFTRGYGYIIEFEQLTDEENKEKSLAYLREKFSELEIEMTPKNVFDEKFQFYKENWKELI